MDAKEREARKKYMDEHPIVTTDHKNYLVHKKPYVFISYKSDDWRKVLADLVPRLQKEYGLRVYYDKKFDEDTGLWLDQFPKNMKYDNGCHAVLVFCSNKYMTSYATLLELMESRSPKAGKKAKKPLPVIPVKLEALTAEYETDDTDTGLGTRYFWEGGPKENTFWEEELKKFNESFAYLAEKGIVRELREAYEDSVERYGRSRESCDEASIDTEGNLLKTGTWGADQKRYYKPYLDKSLCGYIARELFPRENDITGENTDIIKSIVAKLEKCAPDVFEEVKTEETAEPPTITCQMKEAEDSQAITCQMKEAEDSQAITCRMKEAEDSQAITYRMKGAKYDARLAVAEGSYIVRKGSKIAENWKDWIGKRDLADKSGKVGADCILLEDAVFQTISAAAKFVRGCSTSGADVMSEKNIIQEEAPVTVKSTEKEEVPVTVRSTEKEEAPAVVESTEKEEAPAAVESTEKEEVPAAAQSEEEIRAAILRKTVLFALTELVKTVNNGNFNKDSFGGISLVDTQENGKYSVVDCTSTAALAWRFMMQMIAERGEACILELNEKRKGKNPTFLKTQEYDERKKKGQISVRYKAVEAMPEWSMCTNYSQADWIKVLLDRIVELALSPDRFEVQMTDFAGFGAVKAQKATKKFECGGEIYHDGGLSV